MTLPQAPQAREPVPAAGPLREERGQILVLVAIFMFMLIALGGLFIDASMLFLADRSAQHLADSAALSGAGAHVDEPGLREGQPVEPDNALVVQRACAVLLLHPEVTACPAAGVVEVTVLPTGHVQVDLAVPVPLTFLSVVGASAGIARARATVALFVDAQDALPERQ